MSVYQVEDEAPVPARRFVLSLRTVPVVLVAALAVGASGATVSCDRPRRVDKVLLISVDTLRADYLGAYNPAMTTSPHLDDLAADSVVFTDAITQATSTLTSHTSLFYSVHAFVHSAYLSSQPQPQVTSPVEALRRAGFVTAAFVGGGQLRPQFGLDVGFDTYEIVDTRNINEDTRGQERLAELRRRVARFLRRHGDEPFFLFVHNYEPHWPYDPPRRFLDLYVGEDAALASTASASSGPSEGVDGVDGDEALDEGREVDRNTVGYGITPDAYLATDRRARYAAVVRYVDEFIGQLVNTLDRFDALDDTLVIFLSDHGESLGERGILGHNRFYTEQLRVPLIVRLSGAPASRPDAPVELVDVMPTIFEVTGVEPPYEFMGRSLLPLLQGDPDAVPADRMRFSENKGTMAVLDGDWKVIFNPERPGATELYNLADDPRELNNLADVRQQLADRLIRAYYDHVGSNTAIVELFPHDDSEELHLPDDVLRELRALGYIQ